MNSPTRRSWFKIIGTSLIINFIFGRIAKAAAWRKVGKTTGAAGTWQKINATNPRVVSLTVDSTGFAIRALKSDGTTYISGNSSTFVQEVGVSNVAMISNYNSLTSDGFVNYYGTPASYLPNIISISSALSHTLALDSSGKVWAIGSNSFGELGVNNSTSQSSFVQATGISNAIAISIADSHSMALRSDGLVFVCGSNSFGKLGIGANTGQSRSTFVQAVGVTNVIAIAAGWGHSVALRSDGIVFGVGTSGHFFGGAGDSSFVQATGVSDVVGIATSDYTPNGFTFAVTASGTVYATGTNPAGAFGDGTTALRSVFGQITSLSNIIGIAGGTNCTAVLRADGVVLSSGSNAFNQLGDGTSNARSTFGPVLGL